MEEKSEIKTETVEKEENIQNSPKKSILENFKNPYVLYGIIVVLVVLLGVSIFTNGLNFTSNVISKPIEGEIGLIVLNDEKCTACNTANVIATTKQLFNNIKERDVDVNSPEGKKIIADLGIKKVPVYLFEKTIAQTDAWKGNPQLQAVFESKGQWLKLLDEAVGANHWVDEKAEADFLNSVGVVKGDNKPQIDFFVMSYCPYGNQAEEAIEPIYKLLKDKADFKPHYVFYSNYQGGGPQYCIDAESKYCSMHGIQEANQDIREMCVAKYMGMDLWFDFVIEMNTKCNYQNADTCWEAVATSLKLDAEKIKQCEKTEAVLLAKAEQELGEKLGAGGSPAVYIDGESYVGPRTAAGYQSALCGAFDRTKPESCNTPIIATSTTSAPTEGGCGA